MISFSDCNAGEIVVDAEPGQRIAFDVTDTERIKGLIAAGKDYTVAVYRAVEHGMTEYELNAKGERVSTRFAPRYFQMMADFIRNGRIGKHYGTAEITRPTRGSGRAHFVCARGRILRRCSAAAQL